MDKDDKKPREWWICGGRTSSLPDHVCETFFYGYTHVIDKRDYDDLARKLEAMNCEYNAAIDLRNELAKERARNSKLVAALGYIKDRCKLSQTGPEDDAFMTARRALEENK